MAIFQKIKVMNSRLILPLAVLLTTGLCLNTHAQSDSNHEQAITMVVNNLFRAMQSGDSALARSVFSKHVTTATIFRDKAGNVVLRQENTVEDFIKAIGTPHPEVWNEEVWNVQVKVADDFAELWCDYAFYVGKQFSHCGVDAVHLYRDKDGWKIFHLADTRKKTGCNIPQNIQDKYN
jgi:hypothetical protein